MFLQTNEEIKRILGKRIKDYRIESGYSQTDLSKKCGLSVHSVSNIENGKGMNIDALITILRFLNLLDNLETLIPEVEPNPYDIVNGVKNRQRSRRKWCYQ